MNRLNEFYSKAKELNATAIKIECKRKNIFLSEVILSLKIDDKMMKHFYLQKSEFKEIISFIEDNITASEREVKEKTYWNKPLYFEGNRVLVSRHFNTLFIEFDNNNKDDTLSFLSEAV